MQDDEIIALFFARSEDAIGELDRKYGRLCRSLSLNILHDAQDVEECMNDAYLGVWNRIPPERPKPLRAYLCKIVRNLSLKLVRKLSAEKRGGRYPGVMQELGECFASPRTVEDELEAAELARLLEGFLDSLPRENRALFLRRYWFSEGYAELAERFALSEKAVSARLARLRRQCKKYLIEKGGLS